MNREDVIRMAREAGAVFDNDDCLDDCAIEIWARFAALVAAAEREACAKRLDVLGCDITAAVVRARGEK